MTMDAPYLQLRAIGKRFPGVVALSRADLDVRAGEAIALMGANGAGKSTLAKLVSGLVTADSGTMHLAGAAYRPRTRRDARFSPGSPRATPRCSNSPSPSR